MTTFAMGLTLGISALLAGGAIFLWLRVTRAVNAPRCPYCDHARAGHNGTGCHSRVRTTTGDKPCQCPTPYGEPR